MPPELTLETLAKDITDLKTLAAGIKVGMEEDEHKKMEAKKAQDEKEEKEKMEAKKAKYNSAIKAAMEEDDHEKKEAMVKRAMDELHDKKEGMMDNDHNDHKNHEATDEEKEKEAQIASIINEKKNEIITKILSANSIMNPTAVKEVETRLKSASITDVEKEWNILKPAFEGSVARAVPQEKIIPFYANITPADVDASTLSAASPDSEFAKLSTKELLEVSQ